MVKHTEHINQLLEISQQLSPEIAYYPALFCQLGFPQSPFNEQFFIRSSGIITMVIEGERGIPHGPNIRRLLSHIAINAGVHGYLKYRSQAQLLRTLGLSTSGSDVRRLRTILDQLASLQLTIHYPGSIKPSLFISPVLLAYDHTGLVLHPLLTQQVLQQRVPVSRDLFQILSRRPMAIDIYVWLTWRSQSIGNKPTRIRWDQLHKQFASNQSLGSFCCHFKERLQEVMLGYPQLVGRVRCEEEWLRLTPFPPHIPSKAKVVE